MRYKLNVYTKSEVKRELPTLEEIKSIVGDVPRSIDSNGNIEIDKDLTNKEKQDIINLINSKGF